MRGRLSLPSWLIPRLSKLPLLVCHTGSWESRYGAACTTVLAAQRIMSVDGAKLNCIAHFGPRWPLSFAYVLSVCGALRLMMR